MGNLEEFDIVAFLESKAFSLFLRFVVVTLLLLVIVTNSVVITHKNEYTVVKQFGEIITIHDTPGISFKIPFIQNKQQISSKKQIYDLAASNVITKDKKTMVADCFTIWQIVDAQKYMSTLNANMDNAESRINTIIYNSLKNVISSLDQNELISGRDGELATAILKNVGNSMDEYGIEILAVETKMLDLPSGNKTAVYNRMISERMNIAAAYTAEGNSQAEIIRNEADAQIEILLSEAKANAKKLEAEGEAEYMRILSEAYNNPSKAEFYKFVRSLDAAKTALTNNDNILILDEDSPLVQLFNNK